MTAPRPPVPAMGYPHPLTAHDRVCAAIGIVQAHLLAMDTVSDPPTEWGGLYMPRSALDQAVRLLVEALPEVEALGRAQRQA